MMNKRIKLVAIAAAVGVVVAGVGTAGYVLAADVAPASASGYCADMPDAVGLYVGNPVTQMGYKVGKVSRIQPDGDHVVVSFELDSGRRYPVDVKAVTRSKSLLADRSLELVGNYSSGPELTPGTCISLQRSFTPKSISQIAGSAADFIDAMSPNNGKQSFRNAIAGFDTALHGQGGNANALLQHAAAAATSPEQLIADIGSSIMNMAPLSDEALQRWATIRSILDQLPGVAAAGIDLWPGVRKVAVGVGWTVATLYDIQRNYGDLLWPLMDGGVADIIHLAATRSKDIASLLDSIPSVAATLRQQAQGPGGLSVAYQPPTVQIAPGQRIPVTSVLDMVLAKGE